MIALSYAIAASMVDGPQRGLELVNELADDPRITGHYRLDAVRGHLYERNGQPEFARAHYLKAAERTTSIPERNYLMVKASALNATAKS